MIILLILAVPWLLGQLEAHRSDTLFLAYASYIESVENRGVRSSGTSDSQMISRYQEALRLLEAKEFQQARDGLLAISSPNPNLKVHVQFHLAKAYLGLQQVDQATTLLEPLLDGDPEKIEDLIIFQPQIRWFLALAALQAKDIQKAKKLLQENLDVGGDFPKETQELLDKLNSLWTTLAN